MTALQLFAVILKCEHSRFYCRKTKRKILLAAVRPNCGSMQFHVMPCTDCYAGSLLNLSRSVTVRMNETETETENVVRESERKRVTLAGSCHWW